MEWTSEKLEFSLDSIIYYTYNPSVKNVDIWPFDKDQYLLLNVAIQQNIAANFTQSAMEVDYVRVYQQSAVSINQNNDLPEHKFFPNPVSNDLTISFNNIKDQHLLFKIYSIDGKIVKSFKLPIKNNGIVLTDLEHLSKGMYIVLYKINNRNYNLKFYKD